MEQKPLSWGKPQINIGIRTGGAAPSTWQKEHPVVEGTAKLTPTKGTKREAKVEGGENEAVMYTKNTYAFEYEVRVRDGREPIIEDVDGVVAEEVSIQLIPELEGAIGFLIDRAAVSVEDTWDAENGAKKKYTFDVLLPDSGAQVKWDVQTSKVTA